MDTEEGHDDRVLYERLREMWQNVDPPPVDLADRMVAAVAVEDISREYALLTLVEAAAGAAVRGVADTATLQFSDGETNVLLHVTIAEDGSRRIDGWVDAEALAIRLVQDERDWPARPDRNGRFAFDEVTPGVARLRVVVRGSDGDLHDFQTPRFEV